MSTVIDFAHSDDGDRPPRWDRFAQAERFERSLALHAQGVSQRQAAKQLQVPRTTLQAWRSGSWPSAFAPRCVSPVEPLAS